jgi:putative membrane protein
MTTRGYSYRMSPNRESSLTAMLLRAAVNAVGLFLASEIVPGIHIGDWQSLVAGTAIFAIVNALLRPLATFAAFCLLVVTFGLFVLVINAAMLGLTAWIAGRVGLNFTVDGFWSALFGAIVISLVSFVATIVAGQRRFGR